MYQALSVLDENNQKNVAEIFCADVSLLDSPIEVIQHVTHF